MTVEEEQRAARLVIETARARKNAQEARIIHQAAISYASGFKQGYESARTAGAKTADAATTGAAERTADSTANAENAPDTGEMKKTA